MSYIEISLRIEAEEFAKRYRVPNAVVIARSSDGRRVQFPASSLQRFISHQGISGRFRIEFSDQGKLLGIIKLT